MEYICRLLSFNYKRMIHKIFSQDYNENSEEMCSEFKQVIPLASHSQWLTDEEKTYFKHKMAAEKKA